MSERPTPFRNGSDAQPEMPRRKLIVAGATALSLGSAGCLRARSLQNTQTSEIPNTQTNAPQTTTTAPTPSETTTPTSALVFSHTYENRVLEDAVHDVDASNASNVGFRADRQGVVAEFSGDGFYDIAYSDLLDYVTEGDSMTVSMWANLRELGPWRQLWNGGGMIIDIRKSNLRLREWRGEHLFKLSVPVEQVLSTGEWAHIVGTIEADTEARLYVDGTRIGTTAIETDHGFSTERAAHVTIGAHPGHGMGRLDGLLDTLQLRRGAVTEPTARSLYRAQKTAPETPTETATTRTEPPGAVVLWHSYEDSDLSGTVNGIAASNSRNVGFTPGRGGVVANFTGDGYYDIDYGDLTQHISVGDSMSVSAWVRPRVLDAWQQIWNGGGVIIDIRKGNLRVREWRGEHLFKFSVPVEQVLSTGEWAHVVGTVEADTEARLYVDGRHIGTTSIDTEHGFSTERAAHVTIGAHPGHGMGRLDGVLDDVQLRRTALTEREVTDIYQRQQA